jgi:hypothetical protein
VALSLVMATSFRQQISQNEQLSVGDVFRGRSAPFTGTEDASSFEEIDRKNEDPRKVGETAEDPTTSTTTTATATKKATRRKEIPTGSSESTVGFTSGEDLEYSSEQTDSKLTQPLRKKIAAVERNFWERYPRDQVPIIINKD